MRSEKPVELHRGLVPKDMFQATNTTLQRTKAAKAVGTYPPPENDSPDRPYRALTTKSHLARAEPASEPLQLSTSRTRAGLELSRTVPGPRPSPHLSVWSVTHRRMILRINHLFPLCHHKVPPCTGLARAQAAHSELEPNQSRARAEPVQARAEACPTSQCLACATKFCRRMILRIIQGRALITKTHLAWATLHGPSLHHSRSSTPTSRAPCYACSGSSSCRGTNAVDDATPPPPIQRETFEVVRFEKNAFMLSFFAIRFVPVNFDVVPFAVLVHVVSPPHLPKAWRYSSRG